MDGVTVHEENVPGLQVVGLSLNVVGCLSGKKDDHLVKIMIMVRKFSLGLVLDVKKPEILILDDNLSALDFATDAALRKALAGLEGETTTFLVSQRVAGIRQADKILVLDNGELAGSGTHDELMKSCEVYREIYFSQFPEDRAKYERGEM